MEFTPEMDQRIRELYTPPYVRGLIAQQAKEWRCTTSQISHRGHALGMKKLSPCSSSFRWTLEEKTLLRKVPHMTCKQASQYLNSHGFNRTQSSVEIMRFRDGWRDRIDRDEVTVGYSAVGLARLMGVEHSTVLRWIKRGFLESTPESSGDHRVNHRIQTKALRLFLVNHVHYWNPAKVDKYWLMDIFCNARSEK